MKTTLNNQAQKLLKKPYVAPKMELVQLDTEIALVMMSGPPPQPIPQMPGNWPEGIGSKIFKFGW
ncbi:MAG: hypothetical protein ACKOGD_04155 [Sphingomonadales bacterium]